MHPDSLEELLLYDPRNISLLYAKNRTDGYRCDEVSRLMPVDNSLLPESVRTMVRLRTANKRALRMDGTLATVFGQLSANDSYYISLSRVILNSFYEAAITPYSDTFGDLFMENILHARTFITNADNDFIIYAPAIPATLRARYDVKSIVEAENSFTLNLESGESVEIDFPSYSDCGHSVTMFKPEQFFNDVKAWLKK